MYKTLRMPYHTIKQNYTRIFRKEQIKYSTIITKRSENTNSTVSRRIKTSEKKNTYTFVSRYRNAETHTRRPEITNANRKLFCGY